MRVTGYGTRFKSEDWLGFRFGNKLVFLCVRAFVSVCVCVSVCYSQGNSCLCLRFVIDLLVYLFVLFVCLIRDRYMMFLNEANCSLCPCVYSSMIVSFYISISSFIHSFTYIS